MAKDHDGKEGEKKAEENPTVHLGFILDRKTGTLTMDTDIPDTIARYGIWLAGLETMFRAGTMKELEAMATKARIVKPGMAERASLGILK